MGRNVVNTVSFVFQAEDNSGPAVSSATSNVEKLGDSAAKAAVKVKGTFKELAGAYNAMIVAKKAAGFLSSMIKPALDMQLANVSLGTATGLSEEGIKRVGVAAREAAKVTPFGFTEAMEGAKKLNLSLRSVDATTAAMMPTMQFAATFLEKDFSRAAKDVSLMISGMGIPATQITTYLEKWVGVAQATGTEIRDMDTGLKYLGGAMRMAGTTFEDIMPVYAIAAKAMGDGTMAANALKTAVANLTDAKKRHNIEEVLGTKLVDEATGRLIPMQQMMLLLADGFTKNQDNLVGYMDVLEKTFGKRSILPILANIDALQKGMLGQDEQMRTMGDLYGYVNERQNNMNGSLQTMTDTMMGPLGSALQRLQESFQTLMMALGETLLPILTSVANGFGMVIDAVTYLFTGLGPLSDILKFVFQVFAEGGGILLAGWIGLTLLRGAAALTGAAMAFMGIEAAGAGRGLMGSLGGMLTWASGAFTAAGAAGLFRAALGGVASAAKLVWKALLGPATWIFLLVEGIQWLAGAVKDLFATGGGKIGAEKAALGTVTQTQIVAVQETVRAAEILRMSAEELTKAADKSAAAVKKPTPVISTKATSYLETQGEKLAKMMPEEKAFAYRAELSKLSIPMERARANQAMTPEDVAMVQNAITKIAEPMKALAPALGTTQEAVAKNAEGLTKNYENLRTNSAAALDAVAFWGLLPEGIKRNIEEGGVVAKTAQARVEEETRQSRLGYWNKYLTEMEGFLAGRHGPPAAWQTEENVAKSEAAGAREKATLGKTVSMSEAFSGWWAGLEKAGPAGLLKTLLAPAEGKAVVPVGEGTSKVSPPKPGEALSQMPGLMTMSNVHLKKLADNVISKEQMKDLLNKTPEGGKAKGVPTPVPTGNGVPMRGH